jgi:hypothetical protein
MSMPRITVVDPTTKPYRTLTELWAGWTPYRSTVTLRVTW